jgi:hypothetical protein
MAADPGHLLRAPELGARHRCPEPSSPMAPWADRDNLPPADHNVLHRHGDMDADDVRRARQLEEETRRLRRIVADQAMNLQVLKDLLGNGS